MGFKVSLASATLTFVLFTSGITLEGTDRAYSQFFEDPESNDTNSSNSTSNTTSSENPNAPEIVLLSQKLKKASFAFRELVGQVKNIGNDTAESVQVRLTVYDKNGGVIGTDRSYADVNTLNPGQKSTFNILASADDFKGMDNYELSLEWRNPDRSQGYVENAQIYKTDTTDTKD